MRNVIYKKELSMKTTYNHARLSTLVFFLGLFFLQTTSLAMASQADRIALKATVEMEVNKDLAMPYNPHQCIKDFGNRTSIDGRSLTDFDGDIVELWVNFECTYCGPQEPLKAQRAHDDMRIVVRHLARDSYSESLKKALSYEALKTFSVNAANIFWETVIPKTSLAIPTPYNAALIHAFQEAAIDPEAFNEALTHKATETINTDLVASSGRISITPTYILDGIRFPACNFTSEQLVKALSLAKEARTGSEEAKKDVIEIILQGLLGEIAL